jgi:regulatory protein
MPRARGSKDDAPSRAELHEAALAYLARSAATAATLGRALERKIVTWARKAARAGAGADEIEEHLVRCRTIVAEIVARFREVGLVNDAAFAEARAKRLSREGRSKRAIAAHLAAKGVSSSITREVIPHDELGAALVFARKRRIGPYAREETTREQEHKALAAMARAGFDFSVCERALRMDRERADELLEGRRDL